MVRFVADYTADTSPVERQPRAPLGRAEFNREFRWSALPARVIDDHAALHQKLKQIARFFDQSPYRAFNRSDDSSNKGIIAPGRGAASQIENETDEHRILQRRTVSIEHRTSNIE